jgi:hypothetical protein
MGSCWCLAPSIGRAPPLGGCGVIRPGREPQRVRINRMWHVTALVTMVREGTIVSTVCGTVATNPGDDFLSPAEADCATCALRTVRG